MKTKMVAVASILLGVCASSALAQTTLKDAFKGSFVVGAAINKDQIYGTDKRGVALVEQQFNSITPENILKWENVHPKLGQYDFDPADRYVSFGQKNKMFIVGHVLVWHNQTPAWVFQDDKGNPVDRETLLKRMREHIQTVVGRYKDKIKSWDVVNEALNEDGSLRQSPWLKIIGEDFIAKAFEYAHEADPSAELYYNEYSLENEAKRNGAIALMKKLKAAGVPITGIGLQGHNSLDWPTPEQEDATITAFANLGLKVSITELDVDVLPKAFKDNGAEVTLTAESQPKLDPYKNGLPQQVQDQFTRSYADMFRVFMNHKGQIERVTFWGVTDADSWRNDWPVKGRTDYPLLFDREGKPKPAFDAVLKTAKAK